MTASNDLQGAFVIPAYNAGPLVREVVQALEQELSRNELVGVPIVVVNDGSTDSSCDALGPQVIILNHDENRGKGAALQTALAWAKDKGLPFVVTLDADGQHPASEATMLYRCGAPLESLVLGVRNLAKAGAPRPNQLSNAFSNWVLSCLGGVELRDTQCGLRRYPVNATLNLGATHSGYAFESDIVLRAARTNLPIVHLEIRVHYPEEAQRISHFHRVSDPAKNVLQILQTTFMVPHHRATRRWGRRLIWLLGMIGIMWYLLT